MTLLAVIDDSITDMNLLSRTLSGYSVRHEETELTTQCVNSVESLLSIRADIYIIDIELGEISGFDVARAVHQKYPDSLLVACTTHNELVYDAYDYDFFFFIRKQFLESDIERLFRKYSIYLQFARKTYSIKTKDEIIAIPYKDIVYFEVVGNSLYIHTTGKNGMNETYNERKSMRLLLKEVPSDRFVQINKNFCINLQFIQKFKESKVILNYDEGLGFNIPKRNMRRVRMAFMTYLANQSNEFSSISTK